jgi:hypothetical protein
MHVRGNRASSGNRQLNGLEGRGVSNFNGQPDRNPDSSALHVPLLTKVWQIPTCTRRVRG